PPTRSLGARPLLQPRQAPDDRRDRLQASIPHNIVRNAIALAAGSHLVDDLVDRPDEDRWHLEHPLHGEAIPSPLAREPLGGVSSALGDYQRTDGAQLDVVESGAGLRAA